MPLENKQIAAMAAWTLEDFQNDPLGAVAQVRELATVHQDLQRERDAAIKDIEALMEVTDLAACEFCAPERAKMCGAKGCLPKWRGPQPEQAIAAADETAGEYADGPVLAQA